MRVRYRDLYHSSNPRPLRQFPESSGRRVGEIIMLFETPYGTVAGCDVKVCLLEWAPLTAYGTSSTLQVKGITKVGRVCRHC